jgi:hypothetical protein
MQRQAMGVALHIVLLPFFELLHSTFDSYDAGLSAGFFLPFGLLPHPFLCLTDIQRTGERHAHDSRQRTYPDRSATDSRTRAATAAHSRA